MKLRAFDLSPDREGKDYRGHPAAEKLLERIMNDFTYHPPTPDQIQRYEEIRQMARVVAQAILVYCPPSREQSLALTKLEEMVMWMNAAIARNEVEAPGA